MMMMLHSTTKTSKTFAKLFLCYNSLNKVTLLCKVSRLMCIVELKFNFAFLLLTAFCLSIFPDIRCCFHCV